MITTMKQGTILIVDDDVTNVQILHEVLGEQYDILFATSGARALDLARTAAPDLVLLDVMMPGMDGYEVCAHLKADARTSQIPVIFITGLGDVEAETRGLEAGALDYVTKPINPPLVRIRVRNQIELKRASAALASLAETDGLTALANRRRFDRVLDLEFRRLTRSSAPLSLILLDVDHFKAYNDTYGHVAGDACLRRVAAVIQDSVHRGTDLAARYGGEEFALVLPDTAHDGAVMVGERIRQEIGRLAMEHGSSATAPHVTVSVGVVTINCQSFATPGDVIAFADAQLYTAKQAGRDRVVHASRVQSPALAGVAAA